ncbi:Uncharacterised protein [uncultured archaeon]|nr:Uncharacterised protein [uncultured archaeon]
MGETRFGKVGRFEAQLFSAFVSSCVSERERITYVQNFLIEFSNYSDLPRKKGAPRNEGCVLELNGLENLDPLCPEQVARLVKERLHTKYLKPNAKRERLAFIAEINRYFNL